MKKLLIIHPGALGDFIVTFPAIIALRKTYSSIDALCQKKLGDLARELNLIEKSYALESAAIAPLYGDHPDGVAAATAAFLQSYECIILFSFSRRIQENIQRIAGPGVVRIPPRPPAKEKIHVGRFLWDRLVGTGQLEGVKSWPPSEFLQLLPQPCGLKPDAAPVLVHPGSGSRKKNWPLKNFIRLERMLRKDGMRAEFILGPAEMELLKELKSAPAHKPTVHSIDNLLQVLSLLKGAGGFIGNDSGLSHLAAVIGLPTVAVFGSSDPDRWKPLGPAVAVVRADTDCSPCFEDNNSICDSLRCFKQIYPQIVYAAFRRLIEAGDGAC